MTSGRDRETQRELLRLMEDALDQPDPAAWITSRNLSPETLDQAMALIAAHQRASQQMQTAADFLPEPEARLPEGTRVGAYQLVSLIGSGGMADVYRAERVEGGFEQVVAIKVMRRAIHSTRLEAMFDNERQILASLNHLNIARLYDGGTTHNLPYVVMEFIDGLSIDRYAREHVLTLPEVLEMVAQVCDGVQQAHQVLVVHRDIKPSNILVTHDGVPKLLDFGIAIAIEDANTDDDRVLTPQYASPEQLAGRPTSTASDVFALGLLLRDLAPFRPISIDAIIERATANEPGDRYPTAGAIAADLRRYLAQRPVAARSQTWHYRAALFLRRNWLGCSAAALILLMGIAGVVGIFNQAERTAQEAARLTEVTKFLTDMLAAANPAEQGRDVTVMQVLDQAERHASSRFTSDPLVKAALFDTLSATFQGLGDAERALDYAQRSIELYANSSGATSTGLAHARYLLANALTDLSRWDESNALLDLSDAVYLADEERYWREIDLNLTVRAANAEGHGDLIAAENLYRQSLRLAHTYAGPDDPGTAVGYNNLGVLHTTIGEYDKAVDALRQGLAIVDGVLPDAHPDRLKLLGNLATALDFLGEREEAARVYEIVIPIKQQALGPAHRTTLVTMGSYALMTTETGTYERGLEIAEQAFIAARGALTETDHVLAYVALAYGNLLCLTDNAARGTEVTQLAVEVRRRAMGENNWATATAQSALGFCLTAADRSVEAQRVLLDASNRLQVLLGDDHFHTQTARQRLAEAERRIDSP